MDNGIYFKNMSIGQNIYKWDYWMDNRFYLTERLARKMQIFKMEVEYDSAMKQIEERQYANKLKERVLIYYKYGICFCKRCGKSDVRDRKISLGLH